MRVLALDTTTRAGSVALVEDERVVGEAAGDPSRSHAERLPGELMRLLRASGVESSSIDVFAVASGPGSFTGLRIGIATMQGLAFVHGRPVAPVSALDALAHAGSRSLRAGALAAAWMDAYRGEVYSALYRVAAAPAGLSDRLTLVEAAAVGPPAATLAGWRARFGMPVVFVGDGAVRYATLIAPDAEVVPPPLLAGTIGLMAEARARSGDTIDPARIRPLYVRRPDAEVAREQRTARPPGTQE